MPNNERRVCIMRDGMVQGYVRSVSRKTGKYRITTSVESAKVYRSEESARKDINTASIFGLPKGFHFICC